MKFLTPEQLQAKGNMIMVTNTCNMTCGGCNQFCPNIRAKQHWNIPFHQLKTNIRTLSKFHHDISLFGGEPTCHPKWEEIKELLWLFPDTEFWIFTNYPARLNTDLPDDEENIHYNCDNTMRESGHYLPALVAPIDVYQVPDRMFYVELAGKHCWMLNDDCSGLLYNNKAYFCQVAGAFEMATRSNYGWNFIPNSDPFDRTQEEIFKQAKAACYRCAFAFDPATREKLIERQNLDEHSLVTTTNAGFFKRRIAVLPDKQCMQLSPQAISQVTKEWYQSHKAPIKL